jgi:hypothetical protein
MGIGTQRGLHDRRPTVDADGRVRYLYGGIQVAWHLAQTSPSAFALGEGLSAGGEMSVAGTAVQGRVHPFPPDVDFDERIHVVANTLREAAVTASARIIASIRRISGGPVPGRTDIEFRQLLTFANSGKKVRMSLGDVLRPDAERTLTPGIEAFASGGNVNTFWRGFLDDGRFLGLTRVIFVTAKRPDGSDLIKLGGSAEFNLAFLEDPGEVPQTNIALFAWQMCCAAVQVAKPPSPNWLKAAKRAYNYFSTIGDTAHMSQLEPVFRRREAHVEQYASVVDGIELALLEKDGRLRQARTRILTVEEARSQVETAARIVKDELPDSGITPGPATIAERLSTAALSLRPRPGNPHRHLDQDPVLADRFSALAASIRKHISAGVRAQVEPIINSVVRPVCKDEEACKRIR